jgi:hypothetical protein
VGAVPETLQEPAGLDSIPAELAMQKPAALTELADLRVQIQEVAEVVVNNHRQLVVQAVLGL